ncbi:MAG TPA: nuclease-related domain-containing protein [Gaiellaceae bacterium]|nr:nuclease-related domain-containing protein [Gaiellaceae bacterium]
MRERSFESVVRRKVVVAIAPVAALVLASVVAVALTAGGFAAFGAALSLGAAWLAVVYRDEIFRRGDRAGDYAIGLHSDRVVQEELSPLKARHFVKHDVSLPFGGNIDHVVCGPSGAFAIETKTRRYLKSHLPLARRRALWLSKRLDGHWVTPVVCLVNSDRSPYQHSRVWIVSASDLRVWLEARRDRPVDPVFALRAL